LFASRLISFRCSEPAPAKSKLRATLRRTEGDQQVGQAQTSKPGLWLWHDRLASSQIDFAQAHSLDPGQGSCRHPNDSLESA